MLVRLRYSWDCDDLRIQLLHFVIVQLQLAQCFRVRNWLIHYHIGQLFCATLLEFNLNMIVQVGVIINITVVFTQLAKEHYLLPHKMI